MANSSNQGKHSAVLTEAKSSTIRVKIKNLADKRGQVQETGSGAISVKKSPHILM